MKVSNEATDSNGSNYSNNDNTVKCNNTFNFATINSSTVNVASENSVLQQRENINDKVSEETANDIPTLYDCANSDCRTNYHPKDRFVDRSR